MPLKLIIVLDSVRSIYNVGSVFRFADGLGAEAVFTVGITPHPTHKGDSRLPHVIERNDKQLAKTALGAHTSVKTKHFENLVETVKFLKSNGYQIIGLEQHPDALNLLRYKVRVSKISLVLGNEVNGLSNDSLNQCDDLIQIPMQGMKNSLNVASAGSIAAYYLLNLSTVNRDLLE